MPARSPSSRHGRRYTATQRHDFASRTQELRARGRSWSSISDELGVSAVSLQRWIAQGASASAVPRVAAASRGFAEVRVSSVVEHEQTRVASGLHLVTPSGYRVEGLDRDDVLMLLRQLAC